MQKDADATDIEMRMPFFAVSSHWFVRTLPGSVPLFLQSAKFIFKPLKRVTAKERERKETCNKCLDPNFGRVLYCRKREAFSLTSPGAMVIIVVQILINFISTADWNWSCCLWAAKKPLQHKPCWTQQTWRWQSHRLVVRSFGPEKP